MRSLTPGSEAMLKVPCHHVAKRPKIHRKGKALQPLKICTGMYLPSWILPLSVFPL